MAAVGISIHALREEGDKRSIDERICWWISIHALREEGDWRTLPASRRRSDFYPRPPRGGRPAGRRRWPRSRDFYPRPPRGGRRRGLFRSMLRRCISIHALREEGDLGAQVRRVVERAFLSTPSARRATHSISRRAKSSSNFYPRPPRGGRPAPPFIVSPRCIFLSTPSARRATHYAGTEYAPIVISIHALREEGDNCSGLYTLPQLLFLSTPSARRATRLARLWYTDCAKFLSTPSARRATRCHPLEDHGGGISIHALREEGDPSNRIGIIRGWGFLSTPSARRATLQPAAPGTCLCDFYPRPPRGGRPSSDNLDIVDVGISIHALREEGDRQREPQRPVQPISIHALREEGDPSPRPAKRWSTGYFYPRPPRGGRQKTAWYYKLLW